MSTFGSGNFDRGLQRSTNTAPTAEQVGQAVIQPNAPGAAVTPPASPGANVAEQMLEIVGAAGQFGGNVARTARSARIDIERGQRQQEIDRRRAEQVDKALAAQHAQESWPTLQEQIVNGNIEIPPDIDDSEALGDFFEQQLEDDVEGMPESYQQAYRDYIVPRAIRASIEARSDAQEKERANQMRSQADVLLTTPDLQGSDVFNAMSHLASLGVDRARIDGTVLTAAETAARRGQSNRVDTLLAPLADRHQGEQERVRSLLDSSQQAAENQRAEAARERVLELINDQATPLQIFEELEQQRDKLGEATYGQLAGMASRYQEQRRNEAHNESVDALKRSMLNGRRPKHEYKQIIRDRLNMQPGNPMRLSPDEARSLQGWLDESENRSMAYEEVENVLSGQDGVLNEQRHGSQIMKWLRDRQAIVNGQINKPATVAAVVGRTGVVPDELKETLYQHLTSGDDELVKTGAMSVMTLFQTPRMVEQLKRGATDKVKRAIDHIDHLADRGRLTAEAPAGEIGQSIRDIMAKPDEELVQFNQEQIRRFQLAAGGDSEEEVVADLLAERVVDGNLILDDWINNPELGVGNIDVSRRLQGELREQWLNLVNAGMPPGRALQKAKDRAVISLHEDVTFFRKGEQVLAFSAIGFNGQRLPDHMRWSPSSDEDVRKAWDKWVEEGRLPRGTQDYEDEVDYARPIMRRDPETGEQVTGWMLMTLDGGPVTDQRGRAVIYQPGKSQAQKNAEFQKKLESRAKNFGLPPDVSAGIGPLNIGPEQIEEQRQRFNTGQGPSENPFNRMLPSIPETNPFRDLGGR